MKFLFQVPIIFSAYIYSQKSFTNIIDTFDAVPVNIGSCFTASSGIFRPTKTGIYELSFAMYHGENGSSRLKVLKNGVKVEGLHFYAGSDNDASNDVLFQTRD